MSDLVRLVLSGKNLGKLSGSTIYVTSDLYSHLQEEKSASGNFLLTELQAGRLLRGFKHLLEIIKKQNPNNILILTIDETKKINNCYYISIEEFRKSSSSIFFSFYRETGIKSATKFLNENFPEEFPTEIYPKLSEKAFEKNFPTSIKKFTKTTKNRSKLYQETVETLRGLKKAIKIKKEELKAIESLSRASKIAFYQERLKDFQSRLKKRIPETRGKNSWQNWIYKNNWIFGAVYNQPIQKEKVGFDNIPDYIFPSIDGFLDILEIKLPSDEVIEHDTSHPGSWRWSQKSTEAIGQVVNYLNQIELNQLQLKQRLHERHGIDLHVVKPRAFILIGNSKDWTDNKIEGLRKLNNALHSIEIITYNELLKRGLKMIEMYSSDSQNQND